MEMRMRAPVRCSFIHIKLAMIGTVERVRPVVVRLRCTIHELHSDVTLEEQFEVQDLGPPAGP